MHTIVKVLCKQWHIMLVVSIIILDGSPLFSEPHLLETCKKSSVHEYAGF